MHTEQESREGGRKRAGMHVHDASTAMPTVCLGPFLLRQTRKLRQSLLSQEDASILQDPTLLCHQHKEESHHGARLLESH